jgi:pimeloyl-ACP methyl ester carboxylesterase
MRAVLLRQEKNILMLVSSGFSAFLRKGRVSIIGSSPRRNRVAALVQAIGNGLTKISNTFRRKAWRRGTELASDVDGRPVAYAPDEEFIPQFRELATPDSIVGQRPQLHSFPSLGPHGFHRIAYTEWGDAGNPHIVICAHGFTRNSRDFDVLAAALARHCRVICMDVAGRGASDWLEHKEDYDFSLYLSDAAALIARVLVTTKMPANEAPRIDWVGTSMGGLIGMMLAAKANTPLQRLVLNDVGPLVPWSALARLKSLHFSALRARFKTLEQVEAHLRKVYATFGPLADDHWQHVVRHSARQLVSGDYILAYDPGIMSHMRHARNGVEFGTDYLSGVDLWPVWERVACPTLVLRGAVSDLLLRSTSDQMRRRGPKAQVVEFAGVGHAPWLVSDDQVSVVRDFLLGSTPSK